MRPLVISLSVVVVLGVGYLGAVRLADWGAGLARVDDGGAVDVEPGLPVTIEVPEGATAVSIGEQLAGAGVVKSSESFQVAVRAAGADESLKAGVYSLETGMSTEEVISLLVAGPATETFWVTVPEGLRVGEILERLASVSGIDLTDLEAALLDGSVTSPWREEPATDLTQWEGLLFPDTYEFPVGVSPTALLQLPATTMELRASTVMDGYSYDLLIIASLIEAEAKVDEDRPAISSVIHNRLEEEMRLQVDATVLYALGERGMSLTLDDLEFDSAYNTYIVDGLPPTPIGAPGIASLEAAANPDETEFLYYVLTTADGGHSFTASYEEFLAFKEQAKADGLIP